MRVIAGTFRSRTLQAPAGLSTRPTTDRLRETLFNVLAPRIAGARFADLYAGSGAVGIEALSRGAGSVVFVERAPAALKVLRSNLARLGLQANFEISNGSVASWLRRGVAIPLDIIFLDPPYDAAEEYSATLAQLGDPAHRLLASGALVIAEHRRKQQLDLQYGVLVRARLLQQGDAALSFYEAGGSLPGETGANS